VAKIYFEELTPLYNLLSTQTAKKITKRRHREMMALLSGLKRELSVTDLAISWSSCWNQRNKSKRSL